MKLKITYRISTNQRVGHVVSCNMKMITYCAMSRHSEIGLLRRNYDFGGIGLSSAGKK